jgi:23S rRNA (pseudouridine1915-N3)-methyltransferase
MPIRIISVGKKHESWISEGVERYQKRLKHRFGTEWDLLPHSSYKGIKARQEESERILAHLNRDQFVILLDETGTNISSPMLSELLTTHLDTSRPIAIIIGGAYGVDSTIADRADFNWSLSKLVFPHQLVRLILIEQLYRAQEIANSGPYHHL